MTTLTGSTYDNMDYQPYGEQIAGSSGTTHKFEGKERDAETNNDDFGARYYSSSLGRWLSADWSSIPAPVPYANLTNPQTLNLYGMVSDNPESFADLDGHAAMNSAAPITPSDDPICANVDSPKGACNAEGAGEFIRAVTTDANNGQDDPVYQEYLDMVADGQKNLAQQHVVRFEGDQQDRKKLKTSWHYLITHSKHARALLKPALKNGDLTVGPSRDPNNPAYYDPTNNSINVDPNLSYVVHTTAGLKATPVSVVLGHELGHAAGTRDDGPGGMNNVIKNENPIRHDLGLPDRTQYYSDN